MQAGSQDKRSDQRSERDGSVREGEERSENPGNHLRRSRSLQRGNRQGVDDKSASAPDHLQGDADLGLVDRDEERSRNAVERGSTRAAHSSVPRLLESGTVPAGPANRCQDQGRDTVATADLTDVLRQTALLRSV